MFEWVSFRGNYAVHKKVLLNHVIFNKQSQLYSALKINIISKCSIGFHLKKITWLIIKVLLNRVIFNKQSQLYSALKININSKCSIGFHLEETTKFIIKVLLNRVIFNKQIQLFEKYGSIYFRYFVRYSSIQILVPYFSKHYDTKI